MPRYKQRAELFLLAVTNTLGEHSPTGAGETISARDERYVELIHKVTGSDPGFVHGLAPFLRTELRMRSASVILACEYVRACGARGRRVIDSVCQRADEPAEVLGYWLSHHGRPLHMAVKRGVADAATRLYSEQSALKYDGKRRAIRFADVIELTHPRPRDEEQSALFKYCLDQRHHRDGSPLAGSQDAGEEWGDGAIALPLIAEDRWERERPRGDRREWVREHGLPEGWTWERLSGWLPGGMDAEAWEVAIPQMGVMALLRNLRNLDRAGISETAAEVVMAKLTDPRQVARARIWPHHVWLAYREASDRWRHYLARTLDLATANGPQLPGQALFFGTQSPLADTAAGLSVLRMCQTALAGWRLTGLPKR